MCQLSSLVQPVQHVSILLSKMPTLCWMWSSGALIQVSTLWCYFEVRNTVTLQGYVLPWSWSKFVLSALRLKALSFSAFIVSSKFMSHLGVIKNSIAWPTYWFRDTSAARISLSSLEPWCEYQETKVMLIHDKGNCQKTYIGKVLDLLDQFKYLGFMNRY